MDRSSSMIHVFGLQLCSPQEQDPRQASPEEVRDPILVNESGSQGKDPRGCKLTICMHFQTSLKLTPSAPQAHERDRGAWV